MMMWHQKTDRRKSPRIIVEGLELLIDGVAHKIIDLASHSVRVTFANGENASTFSLAGAGTVHHLRFLSKAGYLPIVDYACQGSVIRIDDNFLVLEYVNESDTWIETIWKFDTLRASAPLIDIE